MSVETNLDNLELSEGFAVVKFFATWCGPCKLYGPAYARVAKKIPEVKFFEVDIDERPDLKSAFGVERVPTTLIFNGPQELERFEGAQSTGGLDAIVKDVLS